MQRHCQKTVFFLAIAFVVLLIDALPFSPVVAGETSPEIPVPGKVTMVDLGAKKCIPCKMMAPIMEELEEEYRDKAAIVFIDVWVNPQASGKFGIRAIPTQIFYNADGKEVRRHEGFLDRAAIVAELKKWG